SPDSSSNCTSPGSQSSVSWSASALSASAWCRWSSRNWRSNCCCFSWNLSSTTLAFFAGAFLAGAGAAFAAGGAALVAAALFVAAAGAALAAGAAFFTGAAFFAGGLALVAGVAAFFTGAVAFFLAGAAAFFAAAVLPAADLLVAGCLAAADLDALTIRND